MMPGSSNSRTYVTNEPSIYVNSSPSDNLWGQPPASYYRFIAEGNSFRGYQIVTPAYHHSGQHIHDKIQISAQLQAEFDALERASDEDMLNLGL
jgi:hypothetical protein